jgi:hypothetical protein
MSKNGCPKVQNEARFFSNMQLERYYPFTIVYLGKCNLLKREVSISS